MNELIDKVIEQIKKGWCKGTPFRDKDGNSCGKNGATTCCIVGALSIVTENDWVSYNKFQHFLYVKMQEKGCKSIDIGPLNDDELGSQEKVIEFLESCKS